MRTDPKIRTEQLLDVALKLAGAEGWRSITHDSIASAAGVSRGLVIARLGTMEQVRRSVMRAAKAPAHKQPTSNPPTPQAAPRCRGDKANSDWRAVGTWLASEGFVAYSVNYRLVPDVVFPTGGVQDGDGLLVYYGGADAVTAVGEFLLRRMASGVPVATSLPPFAPPPGPSSMTQPSLWILP